MSKNDEKDSSDLGEGLHADVEGVVDEGRKFFREMMESNRNLKLRLAAQEGRLGSMAEELAEARQTANKAEALERENRTLVRELAGINERFKEVELEQIDQVAQFKQVEDQYVVVANLYVASYQLHATLRFKDVLQVVKEILSNLVGVKRARVFLRTKGSDLLLVAGLDTPRLSTSEEGRVRISVSADPIFAKVLVTGTSYYRSTAATAAGAPSIQACIPLRIRKAIVGLLVVDELLDQKQSLDAADGQIFDLLGAHFAVALARSHWTERRFSEETLGSSTLADGAIDPNELLILG